MAVEWQKIAEYEDIRLETSGDGIAKITIDRPEVRNAFRPQTVIELSDAFERAREDSEVGAIILTGEGPLAFCSGGDQRVRGDRGYETEPGSGVGRFHVTDLHVQMRRLPKPIVAMVAGYAVGGGHVLHVCCDLTIAADNARFGQTGPRVGSFDGGFGASVLSDLVGPKKAKEIWFLCRQYSAKEALDMGLVNTVVPLERLEEDIFEGRAEEVVRDLSNSKQEIINFRKVIRPQRAVLRDLERTKQRYLAEDLEVYFDDIVDASERIWDMLENFKEVVEALEDTNESVLSHRVNEVLRVLTAFSVVILPLTLIASIWGMNVHVPGEQDTTAFYVVLAFMVIILGGMIAYFRKRGFL